MLSIKFDEFFDTNSLEKMAEMYEVITQERLTVKDTGINYRVINHWDEKGIIRFARNSKEGNRKFSFVDYIWIKLVIELRSFGVKLPVIKKIASDLYEPLPMNELFEGFEEHEHLLDKYEDKSEIVDFIKSGKYKELDLSQVNFNLLQILVSEALATRKPIWLLIFLDGDWFPFIKEKENVYPSSMLVKKEFISHIAVSVTEIIFSFFLEDRFRTYIEELHIFSEQEAKLLYHLKEGDYKKIFVLFKSKKHEAREIKKSPTAKDEIMKIIRAKEYREFILIDEKNNEFRITGKEKEENRKDGEANKKANN